MALTLKQALAMFWEQIQVRFVKREDGKGLSTNDFTTEEKNKLASLENTTIDTTLTIEGVAADAKAVGEKLSTKVPIERTINGISLENNITLSAEQVSAIPMALKGATNGVAELDANGQILSSQLPSSVDEVLEFSKLEDFPSTGETAKIYVDLLTNQIYRWGGSSYVEVSPSITLGTTSQTAFPGDKGQEAYNHAVTNKGIQKLSGLYKITTNAEGHVIAASLVGKEDITVLGIPSQDTTYDPITDEEIDAICSQELNFSDTLTDEVTNVVYRLYVSEGQLKMTEVS